LSDLHLEINTLFLRNLVYQIKSLKGKKENVSLMKRKYSEDPLLFSLFLFSSTVNPFFSL